MYNIILSLNNERNAISPSTRRIVVTNFPTDKELLDLEKKHTEGKITATVINIFQSL